MKPGDRDGRLAELASVVGIDLTAVAIPGGAYSPAVRDGHLVYLSGQIPKIGDGVACTGAVGAAATPAQAREAARVCAVRLLGVLQGALGSLEAVAKVVRVNVFIQSAPGFLGHSGVADGASEVLSSVLQCEEGHARTAVGVHTLPRDASVEVDMTVALAPVR